MLATRSLPRRCWSRWSCRCGARLESPNDPSSAELVEQPKKYDGTEVTFAGEAIGEGMVRGAAPGSTSTTTPTYKNVEEGARLAATTAAWRSGCPRPRRGDRHLRRLQARGRHRGGEGVFNAACAQHGGDMDIHATSLEC